jgi:hypothetical protein
MNEAIAIVYSPIVPTPGYKSFRVKDSEISTISKCKLTGFHKHNTSSGSDAFELCSHVNYVDGKSNEINVKVIDLRR